MTRKEEAFINYIKNRRYTYKGNHCRVVAIKEERDRYDNTSYVVYIRISYSFSLKVWKAFCVIVGEDPEVEWVYHQFQEKIANHATYFNLHRYGIPSINIYDTEDYNPHEEKGEPIWMGC